MIGKEKSPVVQPKCLKCGEDADYEATITKIDGKTVVKVQLCLDCTQLAASIGGAQGKLRALQWLGIEEVPNATPRN